MGASRGVVAGLAAAVIASGAAAQTAAELKLPETQVIPLLTQHDKPGPFPILPLVDLGGAPGEMPYRTDKMRPDSGVLGPLMASPVTAGLAAGGGGTVKEAFAQARLRTPTATVNAATVAETAGSYSDGNGDKVRFGYDRTTEQLGLTFRPLAGLSLKAGLVHDLIDDHVLPLSSTAVRNGVTVVNGYGADPVRTERTLATATVEKTAPVAGLEAARLELRYSGLKRRANSFKLRPSTTAANEARPNREVVGATLSADSRLADHVLARLSLSGQRVWHDSTRWGGGGVSLDTISGYKYPGVEMWEAAVNTDVVWQPAPSSKLLFGLRYDYAAADATKLDETMRIGNYTGTPRALYDYYFGPGVDKGRDDHMVSAKVDGEQKLLADRLTLSGSVGRIMRAADTQERYFVLPSPTTATATRQVGNPDMAPEQHYRAELGVGLKSAAAAAAGAWRLSAKGYVDHVVDFISRDRAHGQAGVLRNDNAFIWRNVDADLAGAEVELSFNLTDHWSSRVGGYWRWGENATDGRALYGIDPLEANWLVEYHDRLAEHGAWNAGAKLRAVARQGRLDDDPSAGSGFDPGGSGGFVLVDLFAGLQVRDTLGLRVGVDNLFDRAYAEHNPRTSTDEASPTAVYAPGRTLYARGVVSF